MHLLVLTFIFGLPFSSCKNGIIQEIWLVDDRSTKDVTASARSLQPSNKTLAVNHIDNFDAIAKQKESYLQKVRGFFKAPETGEYKFYSSCSGPCQIFIGQENSANPRRIITQREESLHNEFDRYPDQVSHTIYLEKDKLYFLEGIEEQHGGLGHLSVGVVLPSDKKVFPISKNYLRTEENGALKRKEEISHGNGKDLTKQRDKMIKKLHEINDYIKELTDEVKMSPKTDKTFVSQEKKKVQELKTDKSNDAELKNIGHGGDKSSKADAQERGKEKMAPKEANRKEKAHQEENNGGKQHSALKPTVREQNTGSGEAEHDSEQGGVVSGENLRLGNTEEKQSKMDGHTKEAKSTSLSKDKKKEMLKKEAGYTSKGNDDGADGGDTLVAIVESPKPELQSMADMKMIPEQKTNLGAINMTADISGSFNKGLKNDQGSSPFAATDIGFSGITPREDAIVSGDGITGATTPHVIGHLDNHNAKQVVHTDHYGNGINEIHGKANLMVEHSYMKTLQTGHQVESVHSSTKYHVQPTDDDYDDNDVLQLTNFAKQEISRNGNLSDSAIKNFIKVIKKKLIENGFVKRENMTSTKYDGQTKQLEKSNQEVRNKSDTVNAKQAIPLNKENSHQKKENTEDKENTMKDSNNRGKIFLYDQVVSNLLKLLKHNLENGKSLEKHNEKGASIEDGNKQGTENALQMRAKFEKPSGELEERQRMLSSLYMLSNEIENFKRILQENKQQGDKSDTTLAAQEAEVNLITPSTEAMLSTGGIKKDFTNSAELEINPGNIMQEQALAPMDNDAMVEQAINDPQPASHNSIVKPLDMEQNSQKREGKYQQDDRNKNEFNGYKVASSNIIDATKNNNINTNINSPTIDTNLHSPTVKQITEDDYLKRNNRSKSASNMESKEKQTLTNDNGESDRQLTMPQTKPMLVEGYTGLISKVGMDSKNDVQDRAQESVQKPALEKQEEETKNISEKTSYTDALSKTVEQLLTGVTVPALLSDPAASTTQQLGNRQKTADEKVMADNRQPLDAKTQILQGQPVYDQQQNKVNPASRNEVIGNGEPHLGQNYRTGNLRNFIRNVRGSKRTKVLKHKPKKGKSRLKATLIRKTKRLRLK